VSSLRGRLGKVLGQFLTLGFVHLVYLLRQLVQRLLGGLRGILAFSIASSLRQLGS
jgi:hypothetical protein